MSTPEDGLRNRAPVLGWYPPLDLEHAVSHPPNPHDALHAHLLQALDGVQRTGWPTRDDDMALATCLFDTWCAAEASQGVDLADPGDRDALGNALHEVFLRRHGEEAAIHLTTIFRLSLELHLRVRDAGREGDLA